MSQTPPAGQQIPPGQPYPPQGYYQPGPPPKKKHTVRNVFLVFLALVVLGFAGCAALLGTAADSIDKSIKAEQANDKPTDVTVGDAFTHDGYDVAGGWKLGKEKFINTVTIKNLRVTNTKNDEVTGDGGRTALLTFRLYKGTENLAEITCSGKQLQEGESSKMDCSSTDKMPKKYDAIRVADVF